MPDQPTHSRPIRGAEPERLPADGDRSLLRSEEQLRVSAERVPVGRARLEKIVVTETRTITVEVSHEEVRLVHLPLDTATGDDIESNTGSDVRTDLDPGQDRWMVVSEERVVITKEVVPIERVRLETRSVTEQHAITENVRTEQVALDTIGVDGRGKAVSHTDPLSSPSPA